MIDATLTIAPPVPAHETEDGVFGAEDAFEVDADQPIPVPRSCRRRFSMMMPALLTSTFNCP
jgi:hypothetical protein